MLFMCILQLNFIYRSLLIHKLYICMALKIEIPFIIIFRMKMILPYYKVASLTKHCCSHFMYYSIKNNIYALNVLNALQKVKNYFIYIYIYNDIMYTDLFK